MKDIGRPGVIEFTIVVASGTGYADFSAYGELTAAIITKAGGNPSASWVVTDSKGRGIAGDGPAAGSEINFPIDHRICKGTNRFTLNSSEDGSHAVALYGNVFGKGDWNIL